MKIWHSRVDPIVKILLAGAKDSGKTCLLTRFTKGHFPTFSSGEGSPKLASETPRIKFTYEGQEISCLIFDLGEGNVRITKACCKSIAGTTDEKGCRTILRVLEHVIAGIVVYDVCDRDSFEAVGPLVQAIRDKCGADAALLVVGNKIDRVAARRVSSADGRIFAEQQNVLFFEVSAKSGKNVDEAFLELLREAYRRTYVWSPPPSQGKGRPRPRSGGNLQGAAAARKESADTAGQSQLSTARSVWGVDSPRRERESESSDSCLPASKCKTSCCRSAKARKHKPQQSAVALKQLNLHYTSREDQSKKRITIKRQGRNIASVVGRTREGSPML